LTKGIPEISGNKQGQQESKIVNICRIRYLSATLLLALVVPLSACTANPPASPQIINTPAIAANEPASKPAPEIFADNITATGEAPIGTDIQDNPVSGEPSGLMLISAADSDNMSNYLGKKVIVEGTVVETGVLINPGVGKALVLYFNNPNQHVTGYEAWSKGMTGTDFRVIIRENDVPEFCYRSLFVGHRMTVEGTLEIYNSAPAIFVSDPSQIAFIDSAPAAGSAAEPALSLVITRSTEIADNITCYRYQGTITNNNTGWAVHDLYLGEDKLADCIAPKGCPNTAELRIEKQVLMKSEKCPNSIKFDVKLSGDAAVVMGTDPLSRQVSIPALRYTWKGVPQP
jgi:hypothetical protein